MVFLMILSASKARHCIEYNLTCSYKLLGHCFHAKFNQCLLRLYEQDRGITVCICTWAPDFTFDIQWVHTLFSIFFRILGNFGKIEQNVHGHCVSQNTRTEVKPVLTLHLPIQLFSYITRYFHTVLNQGCFFHIQLINVMK